MLMHRPETTLLYRLVAGHWPARRSTGCSRR
jgi:hypothetical protein